MAPAPASQANKQLHKKSYKVTAKLEVFFTGGHLALSADSSFVVCPCSDQVKVVDLATSGVRQAFPGDSEPITAVAVSPDGQSVFGSSRSLQTKWWDVATGECKRSWKAHDGPVACMAVDASGGLLATGGANREVRVWDVERGFCTHSFRGHQGVVTCVAFHPDAHKLLLVSAGEDGLVQVWDLVTRTSVARLDKHFSPVTGLAFSPSGRTLLSGGRDKVVNVWSLRDYSLQSTIPVFEALEGICSLPDSCPLPGGATSDGALEEAPSKKAKKGVERVYFLTVGERGVVRVWRSDSGACTYEQKRSDVAAPMTAGKAADDDATKGGAFTGAVLLGSGAQLLCTTSDQRILLYEGSGSEGKAEGAEGEEGEEGGKEGEGGEGGEGGLRIVKQLIGYNDEVTDLRFVDKDKGLLAVATNSEQVRVYDISTMACERSLVGHTDIVLCLDTCRSAIGRPLLASAGKDHTVRVWDVETASCLAMANGHMAAVSAVAFSKKSCSFLVSGGSDRTLKVWSLANLPEGGAADGAAPLQLQSKAVVAAHDKDINSVAVSPNDALACSGSQDRTAKIWRLPQLAPHLTLRGHKRGVWSVEFSPGDQAVLTASGDMTVRIWALGDGTCLKTLEGHTGSVLKALFVSGGTQVVSSGADGLLKLWTIRSGDCVNTFDQHEDKVWALTVSPETEMLATGGSDSLVNVWTDCTAAEEEEAIQEQEEELLKDQDLANALADADYLRAVQLAFQLRRPFKMLSVFSELFKVPGAEERLQRLIQGIEGEQLKLLMEYVREWNSNSKHCHVAQRVLAAVLRGHPPAKLLQVTGLREVVEGLLPYSQRHFSRIDRLVRSTFLLDYTLASMAVLGPADEADDPVLLRVTRQVAALEAKSKKKAGKNKKRKREERGAPGTANGIAPLEGRVEEGGVAGGELAEGEGRAAERAGAGLGEARDTDARFGAGLEGRMAAGSNDAKEPGGALGLEDEEAGAGGGGEGSLGGTGGRTEDVAEGELGGKREGRDGGEGAVLHQKRSRKGGAEEANGGEERGVQQAGNVEQNGSTEGKGKAKKKKKKKAGTMAQGEEDEEAVKGGGDGEEVEGEKDRPLASADVEMGRKEDIEEREEAGTGEVPDSEGVHAPEPRTPTTGKKKKKAGVAKSPGTVGIEKSQKALRGSLLKSSLKETSMVSNDAVEGKTRSGGLAESGKKMDASVKSKRGKSRQVEKDDGRRELESLLEGLQNDIATKVTKKTSAKAAGVSLRTPKTDKKQSKKARERLAAVGLASV